MHPGKEARHPSSLRASIRRPLRRGKSVGLEADGEVNSPLQRTRGENQRRRFRPGGRGGTIYRAPTVTVAEGVAAHSQKWLCYIAADDGLYGGGNPFAVLTAVVAPAILTNACS